MLYQSELEFLKKNSEFFEGDPLLTEVYNKIAYVFSRPTTLKILLLWAEVKGNYCFKVYRVKVSPGYKYTYKLCNLNDKYDHIIIEDEVQESKKGPILQEKTIKGILSNLGIDTKKLTNLFDNTQYHITTT